MKITDELSMEMNGWAAATARAAFLHTCPDSDGIYVGVDGCKRLARECGIALVDFGEAGELFITSTYGAICVIAYNLRPPVDAKVWNTEIRNSYKKQMAERKEHAKVVKAEKKNKKNTKPREVQA